MKYSFTKLDTYEKCPRRFRIIYIDRVKQESRDPLVFGDVIHECLLLLTGPMVGTGAHKPGAMFVKGICTTVATDKGLTGNEAFKEAIDCLIDFFKTWEAQSPIIAVEKSFEVNIGGITLTGKIDRIDDRSGEGSVIEVVDYKTGQTFITKAEAENSLQLGTYDIAARQLFPEAHSVLTTFHNIRTRQKITVEHTSEQIDNTKLYIRSLVNQIESERNWAPKLHEFCVYCDDRPNCPAYQDALQGKRSTPVAETLNDLEAVAREREDVARLYRILGKRKKELEEAIRPHLTNGPIILGNVRYRLLKNRVVEHSAEDVIAEVSKDTRIDPAFLAGLICKVNTKELDAYITDCEEIMGKRLTLLRARLENVANRGVNKPKFDARPVSEEIT